MGLRRSFFGFWDFGFWGGERRGGGKGGRGDVVFYVYNKGYIGIGMGRCRMDGSRIRRFGGGRGVF